MHMGMLGVPKAAAHQGNSTHPNLNPKPKLIPNINPNPLPNPKPKPNANPTANANPNPKPNPIPNANPIANWNVRGVSGRRQHPRRTMHMGMLGILGQQPPQGNSQPS